MRGHLSRVRPRMITRRPPSGAATGSPCRGRMGYSFTQVGENELRSWFPTPVAHGRGRVGGIWVWSPQIFNGPRLQLTTGSTGRR